MMVTRQPGPRQEVRAGGADHAAADDHRMPRTVATVAVHEPIPQANGSWESMSKVASALT